MNTQLKEALTMLAADPEKIKSLFQELDRTSERTMASKLAIVDKTPAPCPVEP